MTRGLSFLLLSVALAIAVNFVSTPPLAPVLRPLQRHRWWFLAAVLCALAVIHIWQGRRASNRPADSPDLWAHLRPAISDRVREWVDEVLVRSLRLSPEPFPVSLVERSEAVAETDISKDHKRVRQWAISADVLTLYDTTRGQVLEVLRHPPSPPSGASIIVVAAALASPAGFFAATGLISGNGISKGAPIRKIRPSVVRVVYALGFAVAYSAAFLAVSGTLYLFVFTANPQFIRASGATAPGFMKATFIILILAEPFFLWNIITRHLVRRRLLQALLMAQGVLPRNLYEILSHARLHMLLHHVGDGYFFTHPILLKYFSHQGYRASPPTSLPTRSNERQIGTWAVFAGFVLVVVKLTLENVWRGTWQGGLEVALVVAFLMIVPRLPSGGYIIVRIVIPPPGSWNVSELKKQLAEPSPYIVANAQRAAQIALGDANRRIRLARENSGLIDSLTSLTALREPGLAKEVVHGVITDGVVLGSYLAREDSKPARIPNLTRALMMKPNNILLNGDQTEITVYAVYAAYKLTCSSVLGRYLFLRRMARVERKERASLDNL